MIAAIDTRAMRRMGGDMKKMGGDMKKIALLLVLAAFAVAPAAAASKKKHKSEFDQAMAQNKKNLSLFVQGPAADPADLVAADLFQDARERG